jgi:peptidoglycan-N-acetylglucosamine deacetylase
VLLTFDDGPSEKVTPGVLDRLSQYGARAVFFLVGKRIGSSGWLVNRIVSDGHLIGNHTYSHPLGVDPFLPAYVRDVRRCQELLGEITGEPPRLFRSPMGRSSIGALLAPRILGLRHILWSRDVADWSLRDDANARLAGERLARSVKAGDIVLLHDDNPCVLALLDVLLPALTMQGFDLASGLRSIDAGIPQR